MIWKITIVVILCVLTAFGEVIPFDPGRGLVEVEVTIDGRVKATFGIDTGADRLYIDSTFARKHSLTFLRSTPQRPVVGIDGSSEASLVEMRSLRIGQERLYNLRATAIKMDRIIKDKRLGYPDGLIGHDVLRRFYVTVDYPARTLRLQMGQPDFMKAGKDSSFRTIRFSIHRHLILVEVTFDSGVTAPMILDYCASYTSLSKSLARRLGLDLKEDKWQRVATMSIGDIVTSKNVPLVVTDLAQFKKSLRGVDFEGIVGASFLHEHKLTVDYKGKRIYVHNR
jgi:predicted aspartyl protease